MTFWIAIALITGTFAGILGLVLLTHTDDLRAKRMRQPDTDEWTPKEWAHVEQFLRESRKPLQG